MTSDEERLKIAIDAYRNAGYNETWERRMFHVVCAIDAYDRVHPAPEVAALRAEVARLRLLHTNDVEVNKALAAAVMRRSRRWG